MGIFFAPNANIIPIDFAIRRKCGLITEHNTFIELVFFMFLLHINTELFTLSLVICSYGLNKLQFVGFYYQLSTRQTIVGSIRVPYLFFLWTFWGFARVFDESARPFFCCCWSFALHRQPSSSNFFFQL